MADQEDVLHRNNTPDQGVKGGAIKLWHKVIGYNTTEANRLDIPYASSWDWLRDVFAHPGRKVGAHYVFSRTLNALY
jgi:hypothetical protein